MAAGWMEDLNAAQREAVTCADGPVLVIAGAGTGKTKTLASRVAWLIQRGVSPDRILLLTFTRRAAAEMLQRAGRLSGETAAGKVWGGTFHATANRLLRQYGRALGLSPEFTVMDQADAADMMNLIRSDLGLGTTSRRFPQKNTLASIYSRSVNSRTKMGEVVQKHFPWCKDGIDGMRQIFQEYTKRKREHHVLDYDDLLLFWSALCTNPEAGPALSSRFDHILVDEYQDTNVVQAEILQGMCRRADGSCPSIMVVGDDAQAIYSFRAASVRNILDFPAQFPGTQLIRLEQNYRSVQPILDASNAVMERAKERFTKNLFSQRASGQRPAIVTCLDEAEQCTVVCEAILEKREQGVPLMEQAVLFRAGHHSDQLEVELTRRNIPFVKYGGLKFVEAAHVKDMLAFLRVLENPADELSWFRVLQLLEGIGPAAARRVVEQIRGGDASPMARLFQRPPAVPQASQAEFDALREALAECLGTRLPTEEDPSPPAAGEELPPASQIERIRKFYEPIFTRAYDNPQVRLRDLDQLEQIAGGYRTRGQFLTDLTLDPPTSTQDLAGPPLLDEDFLILSTIHSAKGCEWTVVHLIHAADGVIPSDMATGSDDEIDEERRLLYVAMTRAKDCLNLYFPLRYYDRPRNRGDRHSYAQLTRFIPDSVLTLFERTSAHRPVEEPVEEAGVRPGTAQAVDALLGQLWE